MRNQMSWARFCTHLSTLISLFQTPNSSLKCKFHPQPMSPLSYNFRRTELSIFFSTTIHTYCREKKYFAATLGDLAAIVPIMVSFTNSFRRKIPKYTFGVCGSSGNSSILRVKTNKHFNLIYLLVHSPFVFMKGHVK